MNISKKILQPLLILTTAITLAACGGGGGSTTPTIPDPAAPPIVIVTPEPVKIYRYSELKLGINANAPKNVLIITNTGAVDLVNNTGFTAPTGGVALGNCAIGDRLLSDGRPLVSCVLPFAGFVTKVFPVNPETLALDPEFTDTLPAAITFNGVPTGTFGTGPYASQGIGQPFGAHISASDGIYYRTDSDFQLRKTTNNFVSNTPLSGQVQRLEMFSN